MAYVKVLGAYGGKYAHKHTTAFRICSNIVIDAGNLISGLGKEAEKIRHIFLTHAHFDHIIDIPFLIDSLFCDLEKSITIHALPHTIECLKSHLMNDGIWPDFSKLQIPSGGGPAVVYNAIEYDTPYRIGAYTFTPVRANHIVPTCGYVVTCNGGAFLLSGDTYVHDGIAEIIEADPSISVLMLEVSFPSRMDTIALDSKHLTPRLAAELLSRIRRRDFTVCFYHMKPAYREEIETELETLMEGITYRVLDDYEVIEYS